MKPLGLTAGFLGPGVRFSIRSGRETGAIVSVEGI